MRNGEVRELARVRVQRATLAMTPALREQCTLVCRLFTEARKAGALARHRIGLIVARVVDDPKKYGKGAVKQLASAVGKGESALYSYAAVARRWNHEVFGVLATRLGSHGVPLTFMHFIELAGIELPERRNALLDRALQEGLSVRELRRLVRSKHPHEPSPPRRTTLRRALLASRAVLEVVRPVDRMLEDLRREPSTPKVESQVTLLVTNYRTLAEACERSATALELELGRMRKARDGQADPGRSLRAS